MAGGKGKNKWHGGLRNEIWNARQLQLKILRSINNNNLYRNSLSDLFNKLYSKLNSIDHFNFTAPGNMIGLFSLIWTLTACLVCIERLKS